MGFCNTIPWGSFVRFPKGIYMAFRALGSVQGFELPFIMLLRVSSDFLLYVTPTPYSDHEGPFTH